MRVLSVLLALTVLGMSIVRLGAQVAAPAGSECATADAAKDAAKHKPPEPAGPPHSSEGKSGTTGWSGSLGGGNIATEGGGTRDSSQSAPETAKGLRPEADGKHRPC